MATLTLDEFKELTENTIALDENKFKGLLLPAKAVLENVTGHFYANHDIETDNAWRVKQYKKALCSQIKYFKVLGSTTFEEINSAPQTFSAGRTSVSNASRYNPSGANESKPLVAEEVYLHLEGTGLLYAGVAIW